MDSTCVVCMRPVVRGGTLQSVLPLAEKRYGKFLFLTAIWKGVSAPACCKNTASSLVHLMLEEHVGMVIKIYSAGG